VPLFQERYDLVIPVEHLSGSLLSPLMAVLESAEFKQAVDQLPGYDTTVMGSLVAEID
jgi:putative molybdopterin biosynthesis protein